MLFDKKSIVSKFIENYYWSLGFKKIVGIDEAGRGAIAGPLFVGLVIFPLGYHHPSIKDSKLLTPEQREKLFEIIVREALFWEVASASVEEINNLGIIKALFVAIERGLSKIEAPDLLLIDGPLTIPQYKGIQKPIIKGDRLSLSIGAASILAKVSRDRYMKELAKSYPEYGFDKHKGYATKEHLLALKKYGPTPHHRITFKCFKGL